MSRYFFVSSSGKPALEKDEAGKFNAVAYFDSIDEARRVIEFAEGKESLVAEEINDLLWWLIDAYDSDSATVLYGGSYHDIRYCITRQLGRERTSLPPRITRQLLRTDSKSRGCIDWEEEEYVLPEFRSPFILGGTVARGYRGRNRDDVQIHAWRIDRGSERNVLVQKGARGETVEKLPSRAEFDECWIRVCGRLPKESKYRQEFIRSLKSQAGQRDDGYVLTPDD